MKPARIMIAVSSQAVLTTQLALEGYELVVVLDLSTAQYQVMEDGIDLFVLGIHFDDSRAAELASFIRKDLKHKDTPILIVRLLSSQYSAFLRSTMDTLIKIKTVNQYLELNGDERAKEKLRAAAEALLPAEKIVESNIAL